MWYNLDMKRSCLNREVGESDLNLILKMSRDVSKGLIIVLHIFSLWKIYYYYTELLQHKMVASWQNTQNTNEQNLFICQL